MIITNKSITIFIIDYIETARMNPEETEVWISLPNGAKEILVHESEDQSEVKDVYTWLQLVIISPPGDMRGRNYIMDLPVYLKSLVEKRAKEEKEDEKPDESKDRFNI